MDRLMRPKVEEEKEAGVEKEEERKGPKNTDWRFGPAQYW